MLSPAVALFRFVRLFHAAALLCISALCNALAVPNYAVPMRCVSSAIVLCRGFAAGATRSVSLLCLCARSSLYSLPCRCNAGSAVPCRSFFRAWPHSALPPLRRRQPFSPKPCYAVASHSGALPFHASPLLLFLSVAVARCLVLCCAPASQALRCKVVQSRSSGLPRVCQLCLCFSVAPVLCRSLAL